jgi:hypothetical protein
MLTVPDRDRGPIADGRKGAVEEVSFPNEMTTAYMPQHTSFFLSNESEQSADFQLKEKSAA